MSTTIDQRVVEMRFDNQQFESNVSTSLSTLGKLKQSLNLTGASKGLENVGEATKRIDMGGLGTAVETVSAKFSALQVMGVTALANITNSAVNAGKKIVSALTIDPIKTGFQEYETQINAVQTILANTQSKGEDINSVNAALDELNTYADKTIYNFTEMTRNIGTFTAAGVDLDKSVTSIKGIANLAAVSGSTSQQASTAMYQLSQALAAGKVSLMDWNSVVNAGMGGQVFQDALKRTAENMGKNVDAAIEKYGSFRESLTQGEWLTAEVLTETLTQLSGAYTEADLIAQGYTESQAKEITELADTAVQAATKVKTVTQLWDTLKEAAQSGWTQTWELIIGDFEEAKELWSGVSDTVGEMINASSESRNNLLGGALNNNWEKLISKINEAGIESSTFEDKLKETAKKHGLDVDKLIKDHGSLEKAFRSGAISSDILDEAVKNLGGSMADLSKIERELKKGLSGNDVKEAQTALQALGMDLGESGADGIFGSKTEAAVKAFQELKGLEVTGIIDDKTLKALKEANKSTKDLSASCEDLISNITELGGREKLLESFKNIFKGLLNIVKPIKEAFTDIFPPITVEQVTKFIDKFKELTADFSSFTGKLAPKIRSTFKGIFSIVEVGVKALGVAAKAVGALLVSDGFVALIELLFDVCAALGDFFTSLVDGFNDGGISGGLSNLVNLISDILLAATGGMRSFGDIFSSIGDTISKVATKIWECISTVFNWITEHVSLGDIFTGLSAAGLVGFLKKIWDMFQPVKEFIEGIFGAKDDAVGFLENIKGKISDVFDTVGESLRTLTSGVKVASLVGIAIAVGILAASLTAISELSIPDITKSMFAIGGLLTMLNLSFGSLSKTVSKFDTKGINGAAFAMILMAEAVNILADAIVKLSELSLAEIGKGLLAVGGGMAELCLGVKAISGVKVPLSTSITLLAIAKACEMLVEPITKLGQLSLKEIAKGLLAMGGALGELVAAVSILNKYGGGMGSIFGAAGVWIVIQGLDDLANALKKFGSMSWSEIGRGLVAMGGALTEVGTVVGIVGKFAGFSSIFASGAILIVIQGLEKLAEALKKFGSMTWSEIGRGLVAMGGALLEVGGISGAVGKLAGLSAIFGAGAIWITIQGLNDLYTAFKDFGSMSWEEIGKAFVAMGLALLEVGGISGGVGYLSGLAGIIGAGTIWIATQGLNDLYTAFKDFGSMSWSEIGRGLVAMGGALLEVGGISGGLGLLTGIAGIFGAGAIWVAVQGLEDLANALKKFSELGWDEIGRGLASMGGALAELALGGFLNTFSIIGSYSISEMAEPLGTLADSMKKWKDVTVPEGLGVNLSKLASGVAAFNFSGWGADAISALGTSLGDLAGSVTKWQGVSVPEGINGQLLSLANGVSQFNFSGWGADAIAAIGTPLGNLADSVKKWKDVDTPDTIGSDLAKISEGVKSFSWAFMGAWSIGALVQPLAALPDSVKKWSDVSVPETLKDDLISIADGVKAFSFAFMGGWSMGALITPLANLADSVKKWDCITIPEDIGDQLGYLADGVKSFSWAFMGAWSLDDLTTPLKNLADSVKKWDGISLTSELGENLKSLAAGVTAFTGITSISTATKGMESIATAAGKISEHNLTTISSDLKSLADGIKTLSSVDASGLTALASLSTTLKAMESALSTTETKFSQAGSNLMSKLASGMQSGVEKNKTIVTNLASSLAKAIESKSTQFNMLGGTLMSKLNSGMSSKSGIVKTTVSDCISNAVKALDGKSSNFKSTGTNLMSKFIEGLKSKNSTVKTTVSDCISNAVKALDGKSNKFKSTGTTLMTKFIEGLKSKNSTVKTAVSDCISNAVKAIESKSSTFKTTGTKLIEKLIDGIKSKQTSLSRAVENIAEDGADGASYAKEDFKSAGKDLGNGLVSGIEAKYTSVYNAAYKLGQKAVQGEKDGQKSNSPSKLTIQAGKWLGEGLVIGMEKMGRSVYNSGKDLGENASNPIANAIAMISNSLTNDINVEPTIRPVIDLSEVSSGASAISGMFNMNPTVGVMSNIRSIGSMMGLNQNGNDDVVSAIKDLKKSIGGLGGTTTTIGNITYDDGSNVTNAVESLVRAARIERRV